MLKDRSRAASWPADSELLELLLDSTPAMIYLYDDAGLLRAVNRATCENLAKDPSELIGRHLTEFMSAESVAGFPERMERLRREGEIADEVAIHAPGGTLRWLLFRNRSLAWHSERLFLGTAIDITEARQARVQLAASEERLRELFEGSLAFVCEHDLKGRLLLVNSAAAESLGYTQADLIGVALHALVPEELGEAVDRYLAEIGRRGTLEGFFHPLTRGGEQRIWQFRNRLLAEGTDGARVLGMALDVTERRRMELLLTEQALQDALTGLGNRRLFSDRLTQALAAAERERQRLPNQRPRAGPGVILFDLDGFKSVNDARGHAAGDALLVEIARAIAGQCRKSDTVARLGGDEFALLVTDAENEGALAALAHKLRLAVGATASAVLPPVTASFGIARYPRDGTSAEAILAAADTALYRAKSAGRNQVCTADGAVQLAGAGVVSP